MRLSSTVFIKGTSRKIANRKIIKNGLNRISS